MNEPHKTKKTPPAGSSGGAAPESSPSQPAGGRLAKAVVLYTLARLGLVVLLGAAIYGLGQVFGAQVPVVVAAIFAVVIALPLGMLVFKRLRINLNTAIAEVDEQRRVKREALNARLRGPADGTGR
ncbi:DUF4229 domain-containing protein [Williamsia sp. CHRR-6]|uniref:DUF4229 domain-containing protein n=1 Tax=Williamsia sp. CHRR-6 TaxID=2835871 RepID=UPI001BDA2BA5|nr:DUF4229 domain-containing protein [Williamsia sp. CHRR-6]MBT0565956.1 DUF4229 domain-containing protein [Williamsia sp. CHRR-6]